MAPRACAAIAAAVLTGCMERERPTTTGSSAGEVDRPAPSTPAAATPGGTPGDAPGGTPAGSADGAMMRGMVRTSSLPGIGRYLTDASGRSLYVFAQDTPYMSRCTDACAAAWPPFAGTMARRGAAVRPSMLGTFERRDRRTQSTYNGMPVYYYEDDRKPGDIEGQGKEEFGGRWYLVSPRGEAITAPALAHR